MEGLIVLGLKENALEELYLLHSYDKITFVKVLTFDFEEMN